MSIKNKSFMCLKNTCQICGFVFFVTLTVNGNDYVDLDYIFIPWIRDGVIVVNHCDLGPILLSGTT